MLKMWSLVLVLLFAVAPPSAWSQDDPGVDDEEMQAGDVPEAASDEPGDEQIASDQDADSQEMVEPDADEAAGEEFAESAEEDTSADEESLAADEDMTDTEDGGADMAGSGSGDATADDAAESEEAGKAESGTDDDAAGAMDDSEEEEESADSADDDVDESGDAAPETADGGVQTTDGANGVGAGGNAANANQQGAAPASDPRPAPAPTQVQAAPTPAPSASPAANTGGNQGAGGADWPTAKFSFMVDIGMGGGEIPFQEVTGLSADTQIIEYRDGNSPTFSPIKMPGIAKNGNVTLKKGIFAKDNKLFEWYESIKRNTIQRTTVTIKLLDESGRPVMTWTLANAWPSKITGTDLKSDGNEVAVESIEIVHEGITVSQ